MDIQTMLVIEESKLADKGCSVIETLNKNTYIMDVLKGHVHVKVSHPTEDVLHPLFKLNALRTINNRPLNDYIQTYEDLPSEAMSAFHEMRDAILKARGFLIMEDGQVIDIYRVSRQFDLANVPDLISFPVYRFNENAKAVLVCTVYVRTFDKETMLEDIQNGKHVAVKNLCEAVNSRL